MKDKISKYFSPKTMAVSLLTLALLGAGSAAVLDYFANSTGDVDVQQAVTIDGINGEADITVFDTTYDEVVASETTYSTATVRNFQNRSYPLTYESTLETQDGSTVQSDVSGTQITWNDGSGDEGVRTTYANYFNEAGTSNVASEYSDGDEDVEVSSESALQTEVQDSGAEVIQLTSDITLQSELKVSEDTVIFGDQTLDLNGYQVLVDRDNAGTVDSDLDLTIEGLTISNDQITNNNQLFADVQVRRLGSKINSVDLTVRNNEFTTPNKVVSTFRQGVGTGDLVFEGNDVTVQQSSNWRPALHLDKHENQLKVSDNNFEVNAADSEAVFFGNSIEKATISHNKFEGVRAIRFSHDDVGGETFDISIQSNVLNNLDEGIWIEDVSQYGETNGDLSDISVSENRFINNTVDVDNDHSQTEEFSATSNFFSDGTWSNADINHFEGNVKPAYQTLDQMPEAHDRSSNTPSKETLAIVNEFDTHLTGANDYELTTAIK